MLRCVASLCYFRTIREGRFGIGFNSVYHLTELPAFVSAGKWCSFDPQAKFLPNVNPANPGKMVDFIKYPETIQRYPDQVCLRYHSLLMWTVHLGHRKPLMAFF